MNIALAREIYGQPWFVDPVSIHGLTELLNHYKKGGSVEAGTKANDFGFIDLQNNTFVTDRVYRAKDNADRDTIAVIRLDGAVTKNGGESSHGTAQLAKQVEQFDKLKNVIGHLVIIDSGGGSALAVKYMREALINAKKPVVAFPEDMAASAAYYIATGADHIMANDETALIGSIGTMVEFSGTPKVAENKETGERTVRIYADQSVEKNLEFEEAINNLNFTPMKENRLNPLNDRFIKDVLASRPNATQAQLKGGIFEAGQVVGTLIDSIGSIDQAIEKVKQLSALRSGSISSNLINNSMTKQELQAKHPDVFAAIQAEERERVEAILEFTDVDLEACKSMISEGSTPGAKFFAEMTRKSIAKNEIKAIEEEAEEDIIVDPKEETEQPAEEQETKQSDYLIKMRAAAGLKKSEV